MSVWHIIRCTSGQEGRAERYLERMGYPNAWHPVEKVRISERVWQRLKAAATGKPPSKYKWRPIVTGYVFLPADHVQIHEINGHHPRVWMEVFCIHAQPYRLTDAKMAEMRQFPEKVREFVEEVERARQAAWEAKRPKVGTLALVKGGILEGTRVTVVALDGVDAEIEIGSTLGRVKVPQQLLERVV